MNNLILLVLLMAALLRVSVSQIGEWLLGVSPERPAAQRMEMDIPRWSKPGKLHKTELKRQNGDPIYAVRDGEKLVAYVAAKPSRRLLLYVGEVVSVYGVSVDSKDESLKYVLATHVATEPKWSDYGRLHKTDMESEYDQPIYALRDYRKGEKLIAYISTRPTKSLTDYTGKILTVYGPTVDAPNGPVPYVIASHVALPDELANTAPEKETK